MLKPQQISVLLVVLLLCLSAWGLGKLFWLSTNSVTVFPWQPKEVVMNDIHHQVNIDQIKQSHLFGRSDSLLSEVKPVVSHAPQTRLNLRLVGVVMSDTRQNSLAVIEYQGSQSTYGVHETIEGTRVVLTAVLSDVSVEPIECGNHIPHGEHFDLIVNTHECQP